MSKAERTREFIIQKSAPLFNTKGYEGTSLSDIQEATKLTKGAIYGNFSDKNELVIATFEYSYSQVFRRINEIIFKAPSATESLIAYGNYYVENWQAVFQNGGCPMLNAAIEADDNLPYLKKYVRGGVTRFIDLLTMTIKKGQTNKEFTKKVNAGEYAALIYSIIEGNIFLAKTMDDPKYFLMAAERIKKIVEQELKV